MGGSLPLAAQFHGEGGRRGRMDATTGTPWALKTISWRTGQLEYEVTNAWALPTRLCQPVGNFPQ